MCNQFSRISNPFSWIAIYSLVFDNSIYRIAIRSLELDNPFSWIAIYSFGVNNSFSQIGIRVPRITQSVLSNCNLFPRLKHPTIRRNKLQFERTDCLIRGYELQSERTDCLIRENELPIRGNGSLICENGLPNSI